MFVEKLNKEDWNEYAGTVICGEGYSVSSDIHFEPMTDKLGHVDGVLLDFYAVSEATDEETHVEQVVEDYEDDFVHKAFLIKKFGLNYINNYRQYLKAMHVPTQEQKSLVKPCEDYYYRITHQVKNKASQTSLEDFMSR